MCLAPAGSNLSEVCFPEGFFSMPVLHFFSAINDAMMMNYIRLYFRFCQERLPSLVREQEKEMT